MSSERYESEYLVQHARALTQADIRIAFLMTLLGIVVVNLLG